MLILKTISLEPKHGWAIAKRIQQVSRETLQIRRSTETGRMAKFYALTRPGSRQLEKELASWTRLSTAINLVIEEV